MSWVNVIGKELKQYMEDYYAGRIKSPCDEDCPDYRDGDHYYQLEEFKPLFDVEKIGR